MNESTNEVRLVYNGKKEFEHIAKQLQIMSDFKAGVPRCGYYGVVQVKRIFSCQILMKHKNSRQNLVAKFKQGFNNPSKKTQVNEKLRVYVTPPDPVRNWQYQTNW